MPRSIIFDEKRKWKEQLSDKIFNYFFREVQIERRIYFVNKYSENENQV